MIDTASEIRSMEAAGGDFKEKSSHKMKPMIVKASTQTTLLNCME